MEEASCVTCKHKRYQELKDRRGTCTQYAHVLDEATICRLKLAGRLQEPNYTLEANGGRRAAKRIASTTRQDWPCFAPYAKAENAVNCGPGERHNGRKDLLAAQQEGTLVLIPAQALVHVFQRTPDVLNSAALLLYLLAIHDLQRRSRLSHKFE